MVSKSVMEMEQMNEHSKNKDRCTGEAHQIGTWGIAMQNV